MVRFSFAGQELAALAEGALWWPARRALLVADLHFEKASWFAGHGQLLPPYDSVATLAALTALTDRLEPAEIWCLGDSFHDDDGAQRLPEPARAALAALAARRRWTWISGNHDAGALPGIGTMIDEVEVDGVVLRHEALPGETRPEISGHFHPKLRIRQRGRMVARRCFVATPTKLVLPALGAFTGGLDAADPAILNAVGPGAQALVALGPRLLRFPLAA